MNRKADKNITFNLRGLCNHCVRYDELVEHRTFTGNDGDRALRILVQNMKSAGRGGKYDCVIGLSGGVDSTYVAYLCIRYGLRPLAVHFDNGWNSPQADENIASTIRLLGIDCFKYTVNWNEFKNLQKAFLKASTPDGEIPSDHAINALLWKTAHKNKIKFIISGMNFATESINVPEWSYGHSDWRYIKDVNRALGGTALTDYPHFGFLYLLYLNLVKRIKTVSILNYVDYNKNVVKDIIKKELSWKDYGGKHHESIYTRFYQGYVLPRKFDIDKRYGHLSDLINAGQLSREEALTELKKPTYPLELQENDITFVSSKLGLSETEFNEIMDLPVRTFRDYKNSYSFVQFLRGTVNLLRKFRVYPR